MDFLNPYIKLPLDYCNPFLPFSSRTPEGPAVGRVTRCEGNDMTTKNPIISTSLGSSLSRHVGSLSIPSPFTSTRLRLVPARDGNGNEWTETWREPMVSGGKWRETRNVGGRDRRERWVQGGDTRTHDSASVFRGSFPPLCSLVSSLHISFTYHSPRVAGGLEWGTNGGRRMEGDVRRRRAVGMNGGRETRAYRPSHRSPYTPHVASSRRILVTLSSSVRSDVA